MIHQVVHCVMERERYVPGEDLDTIWSTKELAQKHADRLMSERCKNTQDITYHVVARLIGTAIGEE